MPILHGELKDEDGGCRLVGSFRLHPFSLAFPWFMAIVMFGTSATIWLHDGSVKGRLFAAAFALLMAVGALLLAFQDRTPQKQEEQEILQFLKSLFEDDLIPGTLP